MIKENCSDKNLSLNSLSQMVDKSPAYIGRLFKEKTNRSVSEYILFVRMEKLRELLDTTTQPVNVLSDQVGLEKTTISILFLRSILVYHFLHINEKICNKILFYDLPIPKITLLPTR